MSDSQLTDEEIQNRRDLLTIYRRTLTHLLQQAAFHGGETLAPIAVMNGLHETRENIFHIKESLRDQGIEIDDLPEEALSTQQTTIIVEQNLAPEPGEPPFKGLLFFSEQDSANFFGREQLIERMSAKVYEQSIVAVIGASGSGKSSLVRAGLIPSIRKGSYAPESARAWQWQVLLITPTQHPVERLAASLTENSSSVLETAQLIDDMNKDSRSFYLAAQRMLNKHDTPNQQRLLLIVDQFEETFTLCRDEKERKTFIDNLLQIQQEPRIVLIMVLRADFFKEMVLTPDLHYVLENKQIIVGPMNEQELRSVIEEPARRNNWQFEPGLVDLLLHEVNKNNNSLPLLAHALLAIWEKRQGRMMTLKAYAEIGGIRGAIMRTADNVYFHQLSPEQQQIARHIFLRLLALSEVVQITRRRALLSELISNKDSEPQVVLVLRLLTNARLIITSDDSAEVAHEALIEEWPTLHAWLTEEREALLVHNRLADATNDWIRQDRNPDLLYRGSQLSKILDWLKTGDRQLSLNERAFLDAGITAQQALEQQQAEQLQRQQQAERKAKYSQWAIAGVCALVVLVGLGLFVQRQWLKIQARNLSPMVELAAGQAIIGHPEAFLNPQQQVAVDSFRMEITEVTNQQYKLCMQAKACTDPPANQVYFDDPAFAKAPVVYVSSLQAQAYCSWLGRRLPSMIEWERAARGLQGRAWPWGEAELSPQLANIYNIDNEHSDLMPVASLPAGATPEGIYDLIGNVSELTTTCYPPDTCNSPSETAPDDLLVWAVGGSYRTFIRNSSDAITVFARSNDDPSVGFRCVQ